MKEELVDERKLVMEERERLECLLNENDENYKNAYKQRNLPR